MKRILAIVLTLAMLFSFSGIPVFADGETDGITTYAELVAALAEGGEIKLAADITTEAALVTSGVTATIDLNGNTLKIGAGDNKFNDATNLTIKNGDINIDGVVVNGNAIFCLDEYEETLVTTLTLDNVNVKGSNYSSAYGVFYIGDSSVLNVNGGEWNLSNDLFEAGGVFKADDAKATLNISNATMTLHNVRRVVTYAATTIDESTIAITGDADGVDAEMEHGFNRSPLTVTNSTITMENMVGRGITAECGAVSISENSTVTITNAQEATIDVRENQTVTVDNTSTVTVDAAPTITSGTITGVTVNVPPKGNVPYAYTSDTTIWGETWSNATKSYVIKVLDADDNVMGTTTLNPELYNFAGMNGNVAPTWHISLDPSADTDTYWIQEWIIAPSIANQPAKVELWVDGVKVNEGSVQLNEADDKNKKCAAVTDANGKILSYVGITDNSYGSDFTAALQTAINAGGNIVMLRDVELTKLIKVSGKTVTLDGNEHSITGTGALWFESGTYAVKNVVFDEITYNTNYGVLEFNNATADVSGCTFKNNTAVNCIAVDCNAENGTSVVTIDNCVFTENNCSSTIINSADGTTTLKNSAVADNTADIAVIYNSADINVTGNSFSGNTLTGTNANKAVILTGPWVEGEYAISITKNAFLDANYVAVHVENWSEEYNAVSTNDLSGNYWLDGNEPVADTDYVIENDAAVTLNDYYTTVAADGTLGGKVNLVPVEVSTYEELVAALEKDNANIIMTADITGTATQNSGYGKAGIVLNAGDILDGDGHTLTINGANGTWDCAVAMNGGTVKNLTIKGAFRGIFMPGANGDVVIDNCKLEDVIYTFNSDAGSKDYNVTIKNTTLNGWTSYSAVHGDVTFEGCTFGEGNGYAFCRPYQSTTFTNCEFNEGFEFDTTQTEDNTLEFDGCTYDGETLSAENAAPMFYNGGTVVIDDKTVVFVEYIPVAKIGDTEYTSLEAALKEAADGATIELIWAEGDAPIAMNGVVCGDKTVTITGTATVDWSKDWLFVGRGGEGNGTLIFDNAQLTAAAIGGRDIGIHVSGATSDSTKNDGVLKVTGGSNIELDWLVNRNEVVIDSNSTLTVVAGNIIHGRNAEEAANGEAQTATLTVKEGSTLNQSKYSITVGNESYGVLNVEGTVNAPNMVVKQDSAVNVEGGTLIVTDTLTTSKNLFISGESTVKVKNLDGRATVMDDTTLTNSYIKSDTNGTTRILGDLTLKGGFAAGYFMTAGSNTDTSGYANTITIEDGTTVDVSYGVEFNGDVTLNGGTIKISGGDENGSVYGLVFQSGAPVINTDIVLESNGDTAPIHFTNANAAVNGSISQSNSGGEPVYISYGSVVTVSETGSITTDCGVHVNADSTLKSSGNITGTIKKNADTAVIEISGGTYTQDVSEWCVTGYMCEDNGDGTYGVVKEKAPSADLTYGGYVNTKNYTDGTEPNYREYMCIDIYDVYAEKSLVVKLYSGDTLLATTTMRSEDRDDKTAISLPQNADTTANIVIDGKLSGSWDTEWAVEKLSVDNLPDKIEVWVDGVLCDTWNQGFTNDSEKAEYCAFNGVYKAATVTDAEGNIVDYYATLAEAFESVKKGDTVTLLDDITVTDQIKITDNAVLSDITFNGNGHTITADLDKSNESVLYFGDTATSAWATGVEIKDLTIKGTARFGIALMGGTSSVLSNVTVEGDYVYGMNLYGTHGAVMTDCNIVTMFTNAQDDNPLSLVNTKIGELYANKSEDLADKGKITIGEGSEVGKLSVWGDNTKMVASGLEKITTVVDSEGNPMVAEADGIWYTNIPSAIAAATDGNIALIADVTEEVTVSQEVTITRNGYTASITAGEGYSLEETTDSYIIAVAEDEETLDTNTLYIYNMEKVGDKYQVGLYAGIDSLNYEEIGFEIISRGVFLKYSTNTAYTSIKTNDENGDPITYTTSDFGSNVTHIYGAIIQFSEAYDNYPVYYRPYAVKMDGTRIYGNTYKIPDIYTK